MQKELEKLWYSYLIETIAERNANEKEIISKLSEKDNKLREMLNKEQISALEEYDNALLKVSGISEKNAFVIGFKIAIRILFEAMCNE